MLGAAIVAAVGRAAAEPAEALTAPGQRCSEAAEQAERAWNLPAGLLGAIGRTESGRPDPVTGRIEPWPWAINAAGEGRFLDSAEAAIAAVEDLEARGIRSIDVGCFQINLMYHPDAFASLDAAFDPVANANAAAAFLTQLREKSGGWVTAIALYHSALPERGEPYRMQVLARWYGFHPPLGGAQPSLPAMRPGADPVVVRLAAGAATVRVYTPASAGLEAVVPRGEARRLPRVFMPGEAALRRSS